MLSSVLQAAGYKVGMFTSPYLQRFHERMQVNGQPIPDEELGQTTARVVPLAESMADRPTEFELMTCVGFQWFADRGCDVVVLETGMASVSMLQRRLKLGYSRAARLVDQMEERGIVGPFEGSKPRQLLISKERWQQMKQGTQEEPQLPETYSEHVIPWEDQ